MADARRYTRIAPRGGAIRVYALRLGDPSPPEILGGARPQRRAVRPPTTRARAILPPHGDPDVRGTPPAAPPRPPPSRTRTAAAAKRRRARGPRRAPIRHPRRTGAVAARPATLGERARRRQRDAASQVHVTGERPAPAPLDITDAHRRADEPSRHSDLSSSPFQQLKQTSATRRVCELSVRVISLAGWYFPPMGSSCGRLNRDSLASRFARFAGFDSPALCQRVARFRIYMEELTQE